MKILPICLFLLLNLACSGQNYLSLFSSIEGETNKMTIEEFDFFEIQKMGHSPSPLIVTLDSMPKMVTKEFLPLFEYLSSSEAGDATVELEYKICAFGDCAIRYSLSSEGKGYQKGLVLSIGKKNANNFDVENLARIFTLRELLNILDDSNIDKEQNLWQIIKDCYKPYMFNVADVSCLIGKLKVLPQKRREQLFSSLH